MLLAGALMMIFSITGSIVSRGVGFGSLSVLLVGYGFSVAGLLRKHPPGSTASRWKKSVFFLICWSIFVSAGVFVIVQALILAAGVWPGTPSANDIIVPGAGIIRTEPSFTLAGRLNTAEAYLHSNPASQVILTGGLADRQLASEAQVMAWYLESRGMDPERILLEEHASNTLENIMFSVRFIEKTENRALEEIVIITSDYHLLRALMIARRAGLRATGIPSPSPPGLYHQYAVREFFAIFKSMVFDWP